MDSNTRLPEEIVQSLNRLRGLIRKYVMTQGILFASIFAIACFWLFAWMDYLPIRLGASESPRIARLLMLILFLVGSLYLWGKFGLLRWMVSWPETSLSLLIERKFPSFESSLSTTVLNAFRPLTTTKDAELDDIHRGMIAQSRELAISRIQEVDVARILDWGPLHFQRILLGLIVIASIAGVVWQPAWTLHWIKRFIALSDEPWPRQVRLIVDGLEMEIPSFSGETDRAKYVRRFTDRQATLSKGRGGVLKVFADRSASKVPEYCSVYYRLEDGTGGRANLRRLPREDEQWEPFVLEGPPVESIDQTLFFSVAAEDSKLPGYSIRMEESPIIQQLQMRMDYPDYLQKSSPGSFLGETLEYRNGLRIPQGTGITFLGKANKSLERIDFVISTSSEAESNRQVGSVELDRETFELPVIPLGNLFTSVVVEIRLWDKDGLCADRIQSYPLAILPDNPPRVDFALEGIGTAVTTKATIPVVGKITDDYGSRSTWLDLGSVGGSSLKVTAELDRENAFRQSIDLSELSDKKTLSVAVGSSLTLLSASDDHFDLNEKEHIGRSSPIQLAVVTDDELIVRLERRELAMRNRLELVLGELNQMRELIGRIRENQDQTDLDRESNAQPNQDQEARDTSESKDPNQQARIRQLRAQQSAMQASKSEGELRGIVKEIQQIGLELIHNRIDSKDRRERLEGKVRIPIQNVLDGPYPELRRLLRDLEGIASKEVPTADQVAKTLNTTDDILLQLNEVLRNMIDIQDFQELVDMVRDLIDDQQKLLDQTKKEQKKQVLDLFN